MKRHFNKISATLFICFVICIVSFLLILTYSFTSISARTPVFAETTEGVEDNTENSTNEPEVVTEVITELTPEETIKAWLGTIFGGINTVATGAVVLYLSRKNNTPVAVTVNDKTTQDKLAALNAENTKLQGVIGEMLKLEKGTQDILQALYANNASVDEKTKNVIKSICTNSEALVKDITDIIGDNTKKQLQDTANIIGNVVLG